MARGTCAQCDSYGNGKITVDVRRLNDWMTARFMPIYFCNDACLSSYKTGPYAFNLEDE